ncbi:translational GTPase TypA, partial [Candidatus Gottesmanbacteria bacterium]|nr:translational GTPase TypA [Candidatus Gottesmanbacteria bacterium]
ADFGGEVERVLNMASGAILLVDAAEGPLPQTKFVLKKALEANLKIILIINKIDKKDARPKEVEKEVENLILELAHLDHHLNYTTLYAVGRDGKAFDSLPETYSAEGGGDLSPLFETILREIPDSHTSDEKPFQMLISTLDWDNYVGRLSIGKVHQGKLSVGDSLQLVDDDKILGTYKAQKLFTSRGLDREVATQLVSGDIVAISGIPEIKIGQTLANPSNPNSLPKIAIDEPTIKITIGPNTSPLSGREGKLCSSAQIKERLLREKQINLGLRIEEDSQSANFSVTGRGELHLSILLETMRREGFELEVSKPQVVYKTIDGILSEPFEEVTIDVATDFIGTITQDLAQRKGEMLNMSVHAHDVTRLEYKVSSQNLLGLRNRLLTATRGTAILNTYFIGYFPKSLRMEVKRNGALIAFAPGTSLSFGLANAQERGTLFIGPGEEVYSGMVVGVSTRDKDIEVNVCKAKKQTNVRSENADIAVQLTPPTVLSLEQALDFIGDDELLEITPKNLRLRKKYLSALRRKLMERQER